MNGVRHRPFSDGGGFLKRMKLIRRAFVALAFSVSATVLIPSAGSAQMFPDDESSLALAGSTTVPFTLSGNHIYITADINGKPYAFIFDTGGAAMLSPEVETELKLPAISKARLGGAGDAVMTVDVVRVPSTTIGSAAYKNGLFATLPGGMNFASPIRGVRYGGILGREFFNHLVATIDYEKSTLTLTDPVQFHPDPQAAALSVEMHHGIPNVTASVNGHSGSFAIDAGSSQALTLTQSFVDATHLDKEFSRSIDVEIGRGVGGYLTGTASRAKTLTLGSVEVNNPLTMVAHAKGGAFADASLGGNIGGEILRRFTVTLDVPGSKLYLSPNAAFGEPMVFNRAGMFSRREAGALNVARVIPDSPAAQAGVAVGDIITAINGKPAEQFTPDDIRALWLQTAGTTVSLDLTRNGKPMSVSFTLRDIL